jgi:hypothetical protein
MAPPASVRYTANTPFPSVVTGSGPIGITRANGIWTVAFNVAPLHQEIPPFVNAANEFTTFWNAATNSFSKVAFSDILSQVFSTSSQIFDDRGLAVAASISGAANWIQTRGYFSVGDGGGAIYFRVGGTTPGGFQSADGAWWQLDTDVPVSIRQFGAFPSSVGITNNSPAINRAISFVATLCTNGAGTIHVPGGFYQCNSAITAPANSFIKLIGDATGDNTSGSANVLYTGNDITLLTVNSIFTCENIGFLGKGAPGNPTNTTASFSVTQPAVHITVGGTFWSNCSFSGGAPPIYNDNGFETVLLNCGITQSYSQEMLLTNAGMWLIRVSRDYSNPPLGFAPAIGTNINAWQANHAYTSPVTVSLSGFYITCTQSGTSGGSPPALALWGVNIPDNTAVWQLVGPANPYSLHITGAAQQLYDIYADDSVPVLIDANPGFDFLFSQGVYAGIYCTGATSGLYVHDCEMGCSLYYPPNGTLGQLAILLGPSWQGNVDITGNTIVNCGTYGVNIQGGTNTRIRGNTINGFSLAGVAVAAGVSQWLVTENYFTNPGVTAVIVAIGASDRYIIVNNLMSNTTGISNGGTGTHTTVSPNQ